jgi:uncharacterized protein with PIN domain
MDRIETRRAIRCGRDAEGVDLFKPVIVEGAHLARQAFLDFGKSRHPAGLNFGDCFSYVPPYSREKTLKGPTFHRLCTELGDAMAEAPPRAFEMLRFLIRQHSRLAVSLPRVPL